MHNDTYPLLDRLKQAYSDANIFNVQRDGKLDRIKRILSGPNSKEAYYSDDYLKIIRKITKIIRSAGTLSDIGTKDLHSI